tara:strand:+ start:341 stop:1105 length:765 start_codon:yes stop_codon:yes gene_type:complete
MVLEGSKGFIYSKTQYKRGLGRIETSMVNLFKQYKKEYPNGTPLVCACELGRIHHVRQLAFSINMNESNVVGTNKSGWQSTPLMAAARSEHEQIVRYLLEEWKVDVSVTTDEGHNALHYAVGHNTKNTTIVELLIEKMNLDSINQLTTSSNTPLDYCMNENKGRLRDQIIRILREKGAVSARETPITQEDIQEQIFLKTQEQCQNDEMLDTLQRMAKLQSRRQTIQNELKTLHKQLKKRKAQDEKFASSKRFHA